MWQNGHRLTKRPYKILETLGRGGFGLTYKAQHLHLNAIAVIKTPDLIQRRDAEYEKYLKRFKKEGQRLAKFGEKPHANIVQVRDYFEEEDLPCLVMDYVDGETLFEVIRRRGAIPQAEIVRWIKQIGHALIEVHQKGIVHRDAHPGNIMIRKDGMPILIDFGIAKEIIPASSSTTESFGNKGFAPYEQLYGRGEQGRKPTVDVYTLASGLYYGITGQYPVNSTDRKFFSHDLVAPNQHQSVIGDSVNQAVLKGMALEAQDRPSTMAEWLSLLDSSLPISSEVEIGFVKDITEGGASHPYPSVATEKKLSDTLVQFPVIRVNSTGKEIHRTLHQAKYYTEDLKGVPLEMMQIPGGRFWMGTENEEIERLVKKFNWDGFRREKPRHEVTVPAFAMGKFPVTQAQYQAVMGENPSHFKGENRPVENVSWDNAAKFCQRLSEMTGKQYRLPSEAEWEYACRGISLNEDASQPFYFGETITPEIVNYRPEDWSYQGKTYSGIYADEPRGTYLGETTPVGQFPANSLGLYDLHGNVWEWCADNWHDNYEGAPNDGSAWLDKYSNFFVLCSGSWGSQPSYCRVAYRNYDWSDARDGGIGLRVVCPSA
ncbi:MAG: SUMF1/EgtB/PvdO family nonheme iron enzyme [Microcystaceae cyanobacterium]